MDTPEPSRQPQPGDRYVGVVAWVTISAVATLSDGDREPVTLQEDSTPWVRFTGYRDRDTVPAAVENDLDIGGRNVALDHLRGLGLTFHDDNTDAHGAVVRSQDYSRLRDLLTIDSEPLPDHGCLSEVRLSITHERVSLPWAAHFWAWRQDVDPDEGEEAVAAWAEAIALDSGDLDEKYRRWKIANGSLELFAALTPPERPVDGFVKWLIPGFLARGELVLWVGKEKAGKSTALNELTAKVGSARRGLTFLGLPIIQPECGRQLVAGFISGEDTAAILNERRILYGDAFGPLAGFVAIDALRHTLEEALARFERFEHIDLLVIDTARKFFGGSEDDSGAWGPIFSMLMAWAEQRDCCVIVTHHTKKCGAIRNLQHLEDVIRGSSIAIQRPRFAAGQFSLGPSDVGIGFMKFSVPPSAGEPFSPLHEHKVFRRVAATLSLEPVEAAVGATPPAATAHAAVEHEGAVLDALKTVAADGVAVFRTGAKSLYAMRLPELKGMSRRAVEAAIDRLVSSGAVVEAATGLRPADPA